MRSLLRYIKIRNVHRNVNILDILLNPRVYIEIQTLVKNEQRIGMA